MYPLFIFFLLHSHRQAVYDSDGGKSLGDVAAVNGAVVELEKQSQDEPKPNGNIEHVERGPTTQYGPAKTFVQGAHFNCDRSAAIIS